MDVANLPDVKTRSSNIVQANPAWDAKITRLILVKGWTGPEIAMKLGKTSRQRRVIRDRVRRLIARTPELQEAIMLAEKGAMFEGLDGIAEAVTRRARRGRIDAAKLAFEVTGLHNPRVKHEHSGDIQVTLNVPRPPRQLDEIGASSEDPIVDADVVDD